MLRLPSVGLLWRALGALALGCTPPAPRASPLRPPPAFLHVPIGLCEDYPEESRSLAGARRDFEVLREMGLHTLRVSLGWDGIEPERGRYDFAFWDEFVKLSEEYEVTLVPYVAYTPEWNSSGTPADFWRRPPRDLDVFAELMARLAQRYRGRIHSWELWNEPDNPQYWLAGAGEYAELARRGAEALRAADPELQVVSGGLAGHIAFLSELFDRFDAGRWFDVINLHSYYETWNPEPLETIPSYVDEAAQIIRRHAGRQAIWMAELGYGNYRAGARVSESTTAHFAHEHTLEYQAVALVRSLSLLLSSGEVSLIAWYELK
ncbi:MAG TPA: beta-galactosidase, partial [Polyangiaceae bacterium]|nr:beta-galactosidase [Polyangiaceae bacterium]